MEGTLCRGTHLAYPINMNYHAPNTYCTRGLDPCIHYVNFDIHPNIIRHTSYEYDVNRGDARLLIVFILYTNIGHIESFMIKWVPQVSP